MSQKDYFEKDYYKILGVSKDAPEADIKRAFRKIARENHPDRHPGDKKAEQRFKEASEANDILSDPDKRKEYDEARSLLGAGAFRFQRPSSGGFTSATGNSTWDDLFRTASSGDSGLGDIFGNLFGQSGGTTFRRSSSSTPQSPRAARTGRRGADIEGEVTIDFVQAVDGVTVGVRMVSDQPCPTCRGTGARAGSVPRVCPTCQGSGAASGGNFAGLTQPCPQCNGRGLIVDDPCPDCHGSGRAASGKTMQVRIPAGVTDGQRIRIKGKGSPGENGGAPGDLNVAVHVRPHLVFGRAGANLTLDVPVTYAEAALGAQIQVPTLGGAPVRLKIPAGTPGGRTFRVRGKGVSRSDGTRGDLLATVQIAVPAQLSAHAADALRRFADAAHLPDPRADLLAKAARG
jgi:molecular chaperone DnaJ